MAKILLISVNDINAHGIRMLSAYLASHNHETTVIFLKRPGIPYTLKNFEIFKQSKIVRDHDWVGLHNDGTPFRYSTGPGITDKEMDLLISKVTEVKPDIIGFSVTVPLIRRIAKVTSIIKEQTRIPVIWGGAGATVDPEECSKYCDWVCVGEGEEVILEVAERIDKKQSIDDTSGLCYRYGGDLIKNKMPSLIQDLDALPFQDINPSNKYLIEFDSIIEGFNEISYSTRYHIMGSRGCLFNCSYCTESYYKKIYRSEKFLRRRSPANIIAELKEAKKMINYDIVQFEDEIFSLEYDWLKEFTDMYKKEINLPFTCYLYPLKGLDNQLVLLKEAGVFDICLSLQSGSKRINKEIFNRPFDRDIFIETARRLNALGVGFYTDVITYNPFETEEDLEATLDILLEIPKPIIIFINKLYIIKNTAIAHLFDAKKTQLEKNKVPKRLFDFYVRLFWYSFLESREFIQFCRKLNLLRYYPILLRSEELVAKLKNHITI